MCRLLRKKSMSKFNIRDNAGMKAAVTWVRAIENKHGTLLWATVKGSYRQDHK